MANVFYRFTLPIGFQTCSDMSIIGFSHKMSLTAISIQMTAYSVQQRQGSGCLCWPQSPDHLVPFILANITFIGSEVFP